MKPTAQELYDIEREAYSGPGWDLEDYEAELSLNSSELFNLVDEEGRVQAFLFFRKSASEAWIMHWAVRQKGKGWGTKLMEEFLAEAPRRRIRTLGLEVRASNEAALKIYKKFLFKEIGQRKGYYSNGEDALVFLRDLDAKLGEQHENV